ncbi:MAG: UDP-N-acetylmuramoyl-tripeptide--D-alanyl-D-alanine ligase [Muribaculaceae bacterium]|nr:UDP-N-acetylmuramoyl-tripeptide--D-alanyl-D-alanine ligase [Muribaculaceae bacterium]
MIIIGFIALTLTLAAFLSDSKRCLMMMQQNSYRTERYSRWLTMSGDSTSFLRLAGYVVFFISLCIFSIQPVALVLMCLFGATVTALQYKASGSYKKPLVWTARARRIYITQVTLGLVITVAAMGIFGDESGVNLFYSAATALTGCYCADNIIVMLAVRLLAPLEKRINRRYYDEAEMILRSMPELKVVGITGSYGKTSTKHYLYRILSEHYETLMTPGSYNTTLGVVRTVREMMKPYTEIFIVEMGAKQPGDIEEICRLVHPQVGIVTAVGPQHLESFKTLERVQQTKFELVDSLPVNGLAIINNDFSMIQSREVTNVPTRRYAVAFPEKADLTATDIIYSPTGTTFTVTDGKDYSLTLTTRLLGECNISNLIAAVIAARYLGVPDDKIKTGVAAIEPVEHRLSIKRAGNLTLLDDAFNSNPLGSSMALDVLSAMPGCRVVITPGMIELGEKTYELNREFGKKIAACADIAYIVGHYNREAIVSGIEEGIKEGSNIKIITTETFMEAQTLMVQQTAGSQATVLYENDLPDTFK